MSQDLVTAHLRTLIAIAEEESFELAAQRVGRTQSAVTQQMQKLEGVVGKSLFVRKGRHRILTPAGLTLLGYAREIVSTSQFALAAAKQTGDGGSVRLGVPHEMTSHLLPDALSQFARNWPDIRVVVQVDRSPTLMTMLQERRIDLAVTTRHSAPYLGSKILALPAVWIAAENYQHHPESPLPLILTDEPSVFRRLALTALDVAGISYYERVTSSSLVGIQPAVESGLGVTVRIPSAFTGATRQLTDQDGLPDLPFVNYYAYLAGKDPLPYVLDLLELIKTAAGNHP